MDDPKDQDPQKLPVQHRIAAVQRRIEALARLQDSLNDADLLFRRAAKEVTETPEWMTKKSPMIRGILKTIPHVAEPAKGAYRGDDKFAKAHINKVVRFTVSEQQGVGGSKGVLKLLSAFAKQGWVEINGPWINLTELGAAVEAGRAASARTAKKRKKKAKRPGRLHKHFGIPAEKTIPMGKINAEIKKLKAKKKRTKADSSLLRSLNAAKRSRKKK